jgi:hypothetical protein
MAAIIVEAGVAMVEVAVVKIIIVPSATIMAFIIEGWRRGAAVLVLNDV